jgi:hypothetical protein
LSQRTLRPVAALACLGLLGAAASVRAAPIPVRFSEGVAHGFLTLRAEEGEPRAAGELVRVPQGDLVESRLTFHFPDGSLYAETVVFSQHQVFTLQRYHLVQRGSAFRTHTGGGVRSRAGAVPRPVRGREGSGAELDRGARDAAGSIQRHDRAAPPEPPAWGERDRPHGGFHTHTPRDKAPPPALRGRAVRVGEVSKSAIHYHVVPEFGGLLGFFTSLIGKKLPTLHYWITRERVPAFLGFEGPLELDGPVWRIGVSYRTEPPRLPQGK